MQELQLNCISRSVCFNSVIFTPPHRRQLCLRFSPQPPNLTTMSPENNLLRRRKTTIFICRTSTASPPSPPQPDSPEPPKQVLKYCISVSLIKITILFNMISYKLRVCIQSSDEQRKGSDLQTLARRFWKVAAPYWYSDDDKKQARLQLAAVFALTFATTGISVGFNFLGRDFYNALSSKILYTFIIWL